MRPRAVGGFIAGILVFGFLALGIEFVLGSVICLEGWHPSPGYPDDSCAWRGLSMNRWLLWLPCLLIAVFAAIRIWRGQHNSIKNAGADEAERWRSIWHAELEAVAIVLAALLVLFLLAQPASRYRYTEDPGGYQGDV